MGVPRLRQLLEPYADEVDLKGREIVIDGPGLAYHMLYDNGKPASSPFHLPSYRELGQAVIAWLDEFKDSGATIVAIYFDGYLPSSKEAERKNRLFDMSKSLRSYHSLHPTGVPMRNPSERKQARDRRPPTPSFLVPAVLEALCASEAYAPVTKLVPGEADIFCARHVNASGGVILTSDSDLLVHDLGRGGSVAFYPSIRFDFRFGNKHRVTAMEFSPFHVCERLSLPQANGLLSVAFQVSMDPHVSLQRAIQLARERVSKETDVSEHTTFIGQYLTPEIMGNVPLEPISGELLDPRISELVLKFLLSGKREFAEDVGDPVDPDAQEVPMYLPFLVDSSSRTSAWEMSLPLRKLAYCVGGLLNTRPVSNVVEYRRLQSFPGGTRVELSGPTMDQRCAALADSLAKIIACILDPELRWIVLAIHLDIQCSQAHRKGNILSLEMLQAEANGTLNIASWDFIHLHAQIQGTLYSLRIIQQVYDFVSRERPLPDCLTQLRMEIGRLSLINDFPSLSEFAVLLGKVRANVDLLRLVAKLELGEDVAAKVQSIMNPKKKEKKRKRAKKSAEQQESGARTARQSNNPFQLLGSG